MAKVSVGCDPVSPSGTVLTSEPKASALIVIEFSTFSSLIYSKGCDNCFDSSMVSDGSWFSKC